MSRSSGPTSMAKVFSMKIISCTAKSDVTRPDSNRSSSSRRFSTKMEPRMKSRTVSLTCVCGVMSGSGRAFLGLGVRRRVGVEPASGLSSQVSGMHQLSEQRRAAIFRIVKAVVQHVQGAHHGVEADQVRGLEGAHLVPEAFLED